MIYKVMRLRFHFTVRGRTVIYYPFWWRWEPGTYNYGFFAVPGVGG